jgi:hypothetical protein
MSTEINKELQNFVARIEATLKAKNQKRFAEFDSIRTDYLKKLPEQGYYYFHILADMALIEGFIHAEWYAGDNPEYEQFLTRLLQVIFDYGNKITWRALNEWEFALEQLMMDLSDSVACITAKRKANGSLDFDDIDIYAIDCKEIADWNFELFPNPDSVSLTGNKEWDKRLDGYSASALWNDLRYTAHICEKYVAVN